LKTRLFITIERVLALWTDRIIAISEQQRREISGRFGVGRPEKFRIVPLGIDLAGSSSSSALRTEIGAEPEELLIGIVGRLCEIKNHALLLEAAAKVAVNSRLRFRIVIIGDGHLRPELEQLARELDLTDRVVFTGFRNDAAGLYRDLDVVALTSMNEGTPLTLIEAMSCARPVVATEVGGVVDIMGARRETAAGVSIWDHGLTVPSKDADALARALEWLMARPELRREMGERGKAFVESYMSKTRLIEDVKTLYQELCGADVTAPAAASAVLQSE
jgi:glycosyltransferase involved in cell wall biosynthesis